MELFRALGALVEPPEPSLRPVAEALGLLGAGLEELPETAEHSDLFVFQLYPYASVYLGEEGMLGGEARDRVAGFWRALGLEPPTEPDHLAILLSFYAELAGDDDAEDRDDAQEAGPRRRARAAFMWEHLLPWLPPYLAKLETIASPFYQAWGHLVEQALAVESERLALPALPPLALRHIPALADPREEGAKAFVASLLSPVRCGFLLVRDDLVRAAAELELGRRVGERRFVLEALFSQAPEATLVWLEAFASREAERHASLSAPEPIRAYWRDRAGATATLLGGLQG